MARERAARREAESARNLARAESARNEEVAKFLLSTTSPGTGDGQDQTLVRTVLLDYFTTRLGTELTNQPAVQADLWLGVAYSCAGTGDYPRAITNCQRAMNDYRLAFGVDHFRVALAMASLGRFQCLNKEFSAGKTNTLEAVAIARKCNNPDTLAKCLLDAAKSFSDSGKPTPETIPLLREARRLRLHVVPNLLACVDSTRLLVQALESLASQGRQDEAKAILEEELKETPEDEGLLKLLRKFDDTRAEGLPQPSRRQASSRRSSAFSKRQSRASAK